MLGRRRTEALHPGCSVVVADHGALRMRLPGFSAHREWPLGSLLDSRALPLAAVVLLAGVALLARTGCATTLGFGPRFLHSTGQLHKGGPDSGLFLQITADPDKDLEIPGQGLSFSVLERAQALGDYEALAARGRRVLRVHLPSPQAVKNLTTALK